MANQLPSFIDSLPRYHWAIIIGPKSDDPKDLGRRLHAKEKITFGSGGAESAWEFEERPISMAPTAMILVRVLFGKVANLKRVEKVLRSTPVRGAEPEWNCVYWVQEALQGLQADDKALGTAVIDWMTVRDAAMRYVEDKVAQHRFDGEKEFDNSKVPTWSLIDQTETFP
jgi:hypothetical protein